MISSTPPVKKSSKIESREGPPSSDHSNSDYDKLSVEELRNIITSERDQFDKKAKQKEEEKKSRISTAKSSQKSSEISDERRSMNQTPSTQR